MMQDYMPVSFARLHIVFLQNSNLQKSKKQPMELYHSSIIGLCIFILFICSRLEFRVEVEKILNNHFSNPVNQNLNT